MRKKGLEEPRNAFRDAPKPQPNRERAGLERKTGSKKAVNVLVDAALLGVAKDLGINISKAAEDALRVQTEAERIRRWRVANPGVVESYNRLVEIAGVFGEELLDRDDDPAV